MKHIKKFNEGFLDKVEDLFVSKNDDNDFARRVLSKLGDVDPESIEKGREEYSFTLNKNKISVNKEYVFREGDRCFLYVENDEVKCSDILSKRIYSSIERMYKEEQERLRAQRIGQINI